MTGEVNFNQYNQACPGVNMGEVDPCPSINQIKSEVSVSHFGDSCSQKEEDAQKRCA